MNRRTVDIRDDNGRTRANTVTLPQCTYCGASSHIARTAADCPNSLTNRLDRVLSILHPEIVELRGDPLTGNVEERPAR